jgi:acetyl esterase/lipase
MKLRPAALRRLCLFTALMSASLHAAAAEPQVIEIWPEGVPGLKADASPEKHEGSNVGNIHHPSLTVFPAPADKANGTAVIICPGGGYARLSFTNEGTSPAAWLNSLGVTAFILKYRVKEYGHPSPLQDVLRAIRLVRSRAAEFGLKADRIGVLGFSAGGHLGASAGTLYDAPEGRTGAALDAVSGRPDFLLLAYPVITMTLPYAHAGSRLNLIGEHPEPALVDHLSPELQVTKNTPPTFLVATEEDKTVPVQNSLIFFDALKKAGVPAELHIYQKGAHGFGLKPGLETSEWPMLAANWLRLNHLIPTQSVAP